jgi:hypothetical protein
MRCNYCFQRCILCTLLAAHRSLACVKLTAWWQSSRASGRQRKLQSNVLGCVCVIAGDRGDEERATKEACKGRVEEGHKHKHR